MNTFGLLDFELVDREKERYKLKKFIQSDNRFLWINGESDTGKTFFVTRFGWNDYNYSYIHTEVTDPLNYNLYENIVFEFDKKFNYKFKNFILSNYSGIYNIVKRTISSSVENFILKDNDFFRSLYNELILLIDKNGQNKNMSKILAQYIQKISADNPLAIIIDDVSEFDNMNFNFFEQILFELKDSPNIKIVILTNQIENNKNIQHFLTEKLPCDYMLMKPFDDKVFFAEIILPKFPDDKQIISYIPQIFEMCEGYPIKLKNLFQSFLLYPQNTIQINEHKISINYNYFDKYLSDYNKEKQNKYSVLEQLILKLILPLCSPIGIEYLIKETIFVGEKTLFHTFEYLEIFDTINALLGVQILKKISNKVTIFNNSLHNSIQTDLNNTIPDGDMINHYVFIFILSNKDNIEKISIQKAEYLELISLYAYLGREKNWISFNYKYGLKNFFNGKVSSAASIFDRLVNVFSDLDCSKLLLIGKCYYQNGEYIKANDVFHLINENKLINEELFEYFFTKGKCDFLLLNTNKAVEEFEKAENIATNLNEIFLAINMKIQAYREITNGQNDADVTYKTYLDSYSHLITCNDLHSLPNSLSGFLRNSIFFLPLNEASNLCLKAISISESHNDYINKAFAQNNYAYCLIKQNQIEEAKNIYIKAYNILSNFLIHETAYCLNNIAVCDMFSGNYEKALSNLTKAAMISTSFYANYCIETHTMICNLKLSRIKTASEIADNLYYKINNTRITDLTILRRVNMNLCIVYHALGYTLKATECLNKVKPISTGTLSEIRVNYYSKLLNQEYSFLHNDILHDTITEFEPWLIMFSHD